MATLTILEPEAAGVITPQSTFRVRVILADDEIMHRVCGIVRIAAELPADQNFIPPNATNFLQMPDSTVWYCNWIQPMPAQGQQPTNVVFRAFAQVLKTGANGQVNLVLASTGNE